MVTGCCVGVRAGRFQGARGLALGNPGGEGSYLIHLGKCAGLHLFEISEIDYIGPEMDVSDLDWEGEDKDWFDCSEDKVFVEIIQLQKRFDLNGQTGKLLNYHHVKHRWSVYVPVLHETVLLKHCNFEVKFFEP